MSQSISFYTLGCKLNFSESSSISKQMEASGFQKVEFTSGADIYVINTCSVTDHADRKCKKVVREALKYNPEASVVVIGCYAQLKPDEIANIPGVNLVLGAAEKFNMVQHLEGLVKQEKVVVKRGNIKDVNEFVPGFSEGDRTRSFVKVQDGCDYFCSFCTIPLARGKSRSRTVAQTVDMLKEVGETGIKEVVLTGVNLGDFGVTHDESFYDLITELEKIKDIPRYRISSIEPNLLENRIIDFVAGSEKFMPHFHIPLQSGSDKILESMRRKYRRELYEDRVKRIKKLMPHCAIGVDVIVGYPGETEEDFLETYRFLNELDITYLHVFPYSERPNTTAKKIKEVVPHKIRSERTDMLRILSEKKKHHFYSKHLNQTFDVLFEKEEKQDKMFGFTSNYIKVETDYDPLLVNEIVPFRLEGINAESGCVTGVNEVVVESH